MSMFDEVLEAESRVRGYVRETLLEYSPFLSGLGGAQVYLKLENLQVSGSFKARGSSTSCCRAVTTARTSLPHPAVTTVLRSPTPLNYWV